MKRETISRGVGNIDERYIQEAAEYGFGEVGWNENNFKEKGFGKKRRFAVHLAAAMLALCILGGSIRAFLPSARETVKAYARGMDEEEITVEEEITAAGAVLHTGSISDTGEMKGHPLMFYLTGEDIASVRFSCRQQQINFVDWTEKRDEYGNAQNFTVTYGEDESEYYYLTIDWVPNTIIRELTDNRDSTIASLPEELRNDVIVLEITFENGKTATKAIAVSLREDGTFYAVLEDYRISEADSFVRRPDSQAIPRDILYAQGEVATSSSADAAPMICVDGRVYRRSTAQKYPYEGPEDDLVYLGEITGDITDSQNAIEGGSGAGETAVIAMDGVPRENFQANHPIAGAQVYRYGDDMMLRIDGELWIYEAVGDGKTQEPETQNQDAHSEAEDGKALTAEQIEDARQAALAYYEGTVFTVNAIEYTEDEIFHGDVEGGCSFRVNVSKGGVIQEPDRMITLRPENGDWKVVNEGY